MMAHVHAPRACRGLAAFALVFAGCGAIIANTVHAGVLAYIAAQLAGATAGAFVLLAA